MMFTDPTIADFKAYFFRDFPYGSDDNQVQDQDITNALADAGVDFNTDLVANQAQYKLFYLLLSAHYLVINLQNSSQGVAGRYAWITASKGAGSVSESFSIPQRILDSPGMAMLAQTKYGAKYLQLVIPQLAGGYFICPGTTLP